MTSALQLLVAWQSTTYVGKQHPVAGKAVDGNSDDSYWKGSCSSTKKEYHPWWVVDLGAEYLVNRVVITNSRELGNAYLIHTAEWRFSEFFVYFELENSPNFTN